MSQLNLKHLRYFWMVASHGSITRASKLLHLTPQTISGQLRELEMQVGEKLFEKSGRQLVLTETGRMIPGRNSVHTSQKRRQSALLFPKDFKCWSYLSCKSPSISSTKSG